MNSAATRAAVPCILLIGGLAAIGWQLVWSHHLSLALGASAKGVALTVATTMAGMTCGALVMGRLLHRPGTLRPLLCYGFLELALAATGPIPGWAKAWIMQGDSWIFQHHPALGTPFTVAALALTLGPATAVMGATLPVIGLLSRQNERPLSRLYALNTAGAGIGCLLAAFWLLPVLGLTGTGFSLSMIHGGLALVCIALSTGSGKIFAGAQPGKAGPERLPNPPTAPAIALLSGAAAFVLEVSWFRELRAAWFSTSDSFAVMLFCFLIALAGGAALASSRGGKGIPLWVSLAGAGLLSLAATQALVHFDRIDAFHERGLVRVFSRTVAALLVMGPPVVLLGTLLPTLLDRAKGPREWAFLYASNTVGAVLGANVAAWLLFEWIGPVPTAWTASAMLWAGLLLIGLPRDSLKWVIALFLIGLSLTLWSHRGQWARIPGAHRSLPGLAKLVEQSHGPDATVSVAAYPGVNALYIDGFATTAEATSQSDPRFFYMEAMGRLPMRANPGAKDALVICFGTGQTAHAVRDENPEHIVIADLNRAVFDLAKHFQSNHRVLEDPRVEAVVMDGRAWLRRSDRSYDVVTMEPMPPFFSGSNSLYSVDFYRLVASRLRGNGVFAQWFPLHLMTPEQARGIAAAFHEVFPDSILWLDPNSTLIAGLPDQGILLGRKSDGRGEPWWEPLRDLRLDPGNPAAPRIFDADTLARFAAAGTPVSDDNLLLEYGTSAYRTPDRDIAATIREIHVGLEAAERP